MIIDTVDIMNFIVKITTSKSVKRLPLNQTISIRLTSNNIAKYFNSFAQGFMYVKIYPL